MQATFITLNNEEGSNSMKYLVTGSEGPGFASPMETAEVLENIILPTFDTLVKLEGDKRILAGGLPVGDRAFVFIVEAASNEEVDRLLRTIPAWGVLKWQVTALQTFAGRAAQEREVVKELKKGAQMKSQPQRSS